MEIFATGHTSSRILLVGFALCCCWTLSAGEDYRTWTSTDGKKIEARIVENDPVRGEVQIRLKNGGLFTVPWSRFIEKDQEYLRTRLPVPGIFLDAKSSRVSARENLYRSTYGTYRRDAISEARNLEATIRNNGNIEYPFTVRAWILARPLSGVTRVLLFDFDEKVVKIESGRSATYTYSSESIDREQSNWGWRTGDDVEMDGWVISVHSMEGELIRHVASSSSRDRVFIESWEGWLKEVREAERQTNRNRR